MGEHSEASEKTRVRVRKEKGEEGVGILGIVFCQKGKCSSNSRVKEGCRVEGKRHLATAGLNYPAAECTGACVFSNVCVCVCVKLRHCRGRA